LVRHLLWSVCPPSHAIARPSLPPSVRSCKKEGNLVPRTRSSPSLSPSQGHLSLTNSCAGPSPNHSRGRQWWRRRVATSVSMGPPSTAASSSRAPGRWRREPAGGAADAEAEGWQALARCRREAAQWQLGPTGRLPGMAEEAASTPPGSICFTS
jgi:hypothetical protein